MTPEVLADSFVSLAAFFGLALFMARIAGSDDGPMSRRMLLALGSVALLMLARVAFWTTGFGPFRFATLTAAALIPLTTLFLAEGLLRRHAPKFLKIIAAVGTGGFILAAFFPANTLDPARLMLMLLFQLLIFASIGLLVLTRDKAGLSAAENTMIDRLTLSLLAILPLLITDYRLSIFHLPVRLGGVAILFLCWLGMTLNRPTTGHGDVVRSAVAIVLCALAATFAVGLVAGLAGPTLVQTGAVLLSSAFLGAIFVEGQRLEADARRDTLLQRLADGDLSTLDGFLHNFISHPLARGALVLHEAELAEFDPARLRDHFAKTPLQARAGIGSVPDADLREQLQFLCDRYECTHVLMAGERPLVLVTLSMPQLTDSPGALTELLALQRMALLISRREEATS